MHSLIVIEAQPIHNFVLGFAAGGKLMIVNPLNFERTERCLALSIIPAITFTAHLFLHAKGRLRRAVSDLTLDKLILKEAARGNF